MRPLALHHGEIVPLVKMPEEGVAAAERDQRNNRLMAYGNVAIPTQPELDALAAVYEEAWAENQLRSLGNAGLVAAHAA